MDLHKSFNIKSKTNILLQSVLYQLIYIYVLEYWGTMYDKYIIQYNIWIRASNHNFIF